MTIARTATKSIAGLLLGLTFFGGVVEQASAGMLDAGRVRVSSSSNVTSVQEDDEAAIRVRWERLRVP